MIKRLTISSEISFHFKNEKINKKEMTEPMEIDNDNLEPELRIVSIERGRIGHVIFDDQMKIIDLLDYSNKIQCMLEIVEINFEEYIFKGDKLHQAKWHIETDDDEFEDHQLEFENGDLVKYYAFTPMGYLYCIITLKNREIIDKEFPKRKFDPDKYVIV